MDDWKKRLEKKIDSNSAATATGGIAKSEVTQQLKILLKRHKGKVTRRYSMSEKDLILKLVDAFGSKTVNEELKVSYDIIARFKRSRERGYPRLETAVKYAPVVETMKKYPGMGPMQLRDYIHRHLGISMGVNSVRKVMEDNGWISSYSRTINVDKEVRHYESIRRNHLWHIDFKHFYINKCKAYLLFIEDDHSPFIIGHAFADGERVETVIEAIQEAINRHGLPQMIMSDGGSAFHSWRGQSKFTQFLEDYGIDHYLSKLPRINGKVESINQKIEKEVLNVQSFSSINHLTEELVKWIFFYNFKRTHQGLEGLLVRILLKRSNGLSENGERSSYAPWFKEAVYDLLHTPDVSFHEVCNLTGIPIKTLENFKEFTACILLEKKPLSEFHQLIGDAWKKAFDYKKKIRCFC